mmetsp:Transcript_23458/g.32797  ORF Transcript_23458/g.32797 Transcript_23458/m.32797 type:complete len:322 (+) Transcript_23458:145-1110(+)|eukprot:CAMPEP_0168555550 /NCGR_PEP_ID=MMETSP0413-20121227/8398_1 /TAXON_ID=136452 /ORGANISM="Filamoeba nolandi, Strain NC-AS-23-1" /LENGTH=321 /DNA_ID=CAMNT_0008586415 /DNA_START=65 /DNA_END=1033 /DNA_ORIENTATION=-
MEARWDVDFSKFLSDGNCQSEVLESYQQLGFFVFRGVFDENEISEIRSHVKWLMQKYPTIRPEHFHHPLMIRDAFWLRVVCKKKILDILEKFLGANIAVFTSHYICKPAYDGQPVFWHQDISYWNLDPPEAVSAWLAIDESTPENGCLRVIPGTHQSATLFGQKVPRLEQPNLLSSSMEDSTIQQLIQHKQIIDLVMKPGDLSIHNPFLVHSSNANTSARSRYALDTAYISTKTIVKTKNTYQNLFLVKGTEQNSTNLYTPLPQFVSGETIEFPEWKEWNDGVKIANAQLKNPNTIDVWQLAVEDMTKKMIAALQNGTTDC